MAGSSTGAGHPLFRARPGLGGRVGVDDEWGVAGSREFPTGLAILNLRTSEMRIAGQTRSGSGLWHVHGSADGRWAVGDDFNRDIYLIDRTNSELILLSTGHKESAQDHPHPTFSPDGTRIHIQSAMLSEDDRSMNMVITVGRQSSCRVIAQVPLLRSTKAPISWRACHGLPLSFITFRGSRIGWIATA